MTTSKVASMRDAVADLDRDGDTVAAHRSEIARRAAAGAMLDGEVDG